MTRRNKLGNDLRARVLQLADGQLRLALQGHRHPALWIPVALIYGALFWFARQQAPAADAAALVHPLTAVAVIAAICHPLLLWWLTAQGLVFDAHREEVVHWRRGPLGGKRRVFPRSAVRRAVCEHRHDAWTVTLRLSPKLGTRRLPILCSKHAVAIRFDPSGARPHGNLTQL